MSREETISKKVCDYVRAKYPIIDVIPVQGLFNLQCHRNSVQYAKDNPEYGVAQVIYTSGDKNILHYVNTKAGEYFETTLGHESQEHEYHLIKHIHKSDYEYIRGEFSRDLDVWLMQFTNWFDRNVLRIERVL